MKLEIEFHFKFEIMQMKNNEADQIETWESSASTLLENVKATGLTVEIFKTDVHNEQVANQLIKDLHQLFPAFKINFDLHDCDKILRIAGEENITDSVTDFITSKGYICQ